MTSTAGTERARSSDIGTWWRRLAYPTRFAMLIGIAACVTVLSGPVEEWLRAGVQAAVVALVPLAGLTPLEMADHVVLFIGSQSTFSYRIVGECAGLAAILMFVAAVLAYPIALRKRLVGIAVGVPLLVLANIGRLVTLALVGVDHATSFPVIHDIGWPLFQLGGISIGTLVWLAWATKSRRPRQQQTYRTKLRPVLVAAIFAVVLPVSLLAGVQRIYDIGSHTILSLVLSAWGRSLIWGGFDTAEASSARLAVLFAAIAVGAAISSPYHRVRQISALAASVIAIQALALTVDAALLAIALRPEDTAGQAPSTGSTIFTMMEFGGIALLLLHQVNRRMPRFR